MHHHGRAGVVAVGVDSPPRERVAAAVGGGGDELPATLGPESDLVTEIARDPEDLLRRPERDGRPTIGILLAATATGNDAVIECVVCGFDTPLAVSTYIATAARPEDVRRAPRWSWTSPTS